METAHEGQSVQEFTEKVKKMIGYDGDISPDADLVSLGLNSKRAARLVFDLEKTYNIMFEDEELWIENFSTIHKIMDRLRKKLTLEGMGHELRD